MSAASMDAIELLLSRTSAIKLQDPGPSRRELEILLNCAVTAPDHGRLRPWRFVVFQGASIDRLGEIMGDATGTEGASEKAQAGEKARAHRAPVVIAVAAHPIPDHKAPASEQVHAAVTAGEHLMLGAPALGFGAMWKTGRAAYSPHVKAAIGLQVTDTIVGFIYLGSEDGAPSPLPRAEARDVVSWWE